MFIRIVRVLDYYVYHFYKDVWVVRTIIVVVLIRIVLVIGISRIM